MSATDRSAPDPLNAATQTAHAARVGPNAILQLIAPLRERVGDDGIEELFEAAGLVAYLCSPPDEMVPQAEVRRLFDTLLDWARADADGVLYEAGQGTASYVMANRIPAPARALLRILPPAPAARLLLKAIEKNAWTFAGSGRCRTRPGRPAVIEIEANPIATPGCPWHRGVFAGLFEQLVKSGIRVKHPVCSASGGGLCRFEVDWS